MPVDWIEIQNTLTPVKDYEDLSRRWQEAFAYPFVRDVYTFSIPRLAVYTRTLLGGDAHGRYAGYEAGLQKTFARLQQAGVRDIPALMARANTRSQFEGLVAQTEIPAKELIMMLKYLVYWIIPAKKYLGGLLQDYEPLSVAIESLRGMGIRFNLDILQEGIAPAQRKTLSETSRLPEPVIDELVNRADFSRLPWASKATISNIIGAGYGSLSKLANAEPGQLFEDFFRYGKAIGKNLKFGNEIENTYRIARLLPAVVKE